MSISLKPVLVGPFLVPSRIGATRTPADLPSLCSRAPEPSSIVLALLGVAALLGYFCCRTTGYVPRHTSYCKCEQIRVNCRLLRQTSDRLLLCENAVFPGPFYAKTCGSLTRLLIRRLQVRFLSGVFYKSQTDSDLRVPAFVLFALRSRSVT